MWRNQNWMPPPSALLILRLCREEIAVFRKRFASFLFKTISYFLIDCRVFGFFLKLSKKIINRGFIRFWIFSGLLCSICKANGLFRIDPLQHQGPKSNSDVGQQIRWTHPNSGGNGQIWVHAKYAWPLQCRKWVSGSWISTFRGFFFSPNFW